MLISPDLHVWAATDSYLQAINTPEEAVVGKPFFEAFTDSGLPWNRASLEQVRNALQTALQQKEPVTLNPIRFDIAQGQEMYWQAVNTPVCDKEGEVAYILHEARNITEQVQAEREARVSLESLELMSLTANGTLWDYDLQQDTITWSKSYKQLFGYTGQEPAYSAASWMHHVHPQDAAQIRRTFFQLLKEQKSDFCVEYRFKRADGTYADVLSHGYVFYSASGQPLRLIGSAADISLQKSHQRQLADISERFQRIATATNDVIWDWNLTDDTIWWNEGYKTLLSFAEDEAGTTDSAFWTERIHPDDRARVKASIHKAINGGQLAWQEEYRFRCADGSYKLIQDRGSIIRDSNGKPTRMIGAMHDITEKRQVEQQLRESSARITQILEAQPLMAWTATPEGTIDYYSSRWYEYTGADPATQDDWANYLHPDDRQRAWERWLHSIATGEAFSDENRWKSGKDGTYRWFLGKALPIRDSEGSITMWVGSHTDIEEQKQALLTLQESNDRFRLLAESIPHIVWSSTPDGRVDYFNQQWYDYTRMTQEETLGFGWSLTLHPDDLAATTEDWLASMENGLPYERELRLRNVETQEYRWFLARGLPIRNAEGELFKWFGTATDIHDQKLLQEQLLESERSFRFLTESIPQMVWTATPDGTTDYFNSRWISYTGLSLEESQGPDAWLKAMHPDDHQKARERWLLSVQSGDYYEIEYRIRNGSKGTYRWFLGQGIPMRDASGAIVKWFGTCTDIEDHKKAEEELVEKNLELERINQDLDSFVYTASHDLKLPVINMAGVFEELIRDAQFKDPEAPQLIEMFNKSLRQLHNTIYDLSEVVRVQKSRDRELKDLSLQGTTDDVLTSLQDMLHESGTVVHTDFSEAPLVAFTRAGLKSILYNLISNAIKYRAQDRPPEIRLRSGIKGNYVEVSVADNGLGIDMTRHQGKLFQMFKRFHSHVKGSGLGLYIVNRLLSSHGGHINIESTLNEGTTFYLYFKMKKS